MQISAIYLNNPAVGASMHGDEFGMEPATNDAIPSKLDMVLFEEIDELMDNAIAYREEEKECQRKMEKYEKNIKVAEEMIEKAQMKKDALMKRNEFLRNCLEDRECARKRALKYWEDYGIDVKQLSTDADKFQHYEFNFTKLPCKIVKQTRTEESTTSCVIGLKYHEGKLEIVEQIPEILQPDNLKALNMRLTTNCINQNADLVDYKLAMLIMRKDLIKALASRPRICSRPPTETNNHTYT